MVRPETSRILEPTVIHKPGRLWLVQGCSKTGILTLYTAMFQMGKMYLLRSPVKADHI